MARQMTRKEYEETYGSSPVLSNSVIDNTPAPVRMTRAEYDARYKKPEEASFKDDFLGDISETKQAQQAAVQEGVKRTDEIEKRVASGETSRTKGAFQKFGAGLGTASNVLFQTALGGAKAVLPQSTEEAVGGAVETAASELKDRFAKQYEELKQDPKQDAQTAVDFVEDVKDAFKNDPNFKADVQAAGSVLEWLALPTAATKTTSKLSKSAAEGISRIDIEPLVKRVTQPKDVKIEASRVADLKKLEDKNAALRRLNEFSKDGGEGSRSRIARSNVLEGVADEDGVLRTKGTGGAVEQYRKATIEGVEDVVRRNLEREGRTVSLPEVKNLMRTTIIDAGLEGGDLVTALKGVEKEIKGLAIRMDELGQVGLEKLQDAKINTTKNINFNTPPETKTYRKALARSYKELIEKKSDFNVKEVNTELSKFYKDIERLEALDGKRVKGGRLGKYFAQVSGNIIGGAAGSAVGGPVGTALGTIAGGEAAGFIAGKSMARSFGKGGVLPEKNSILAAARKEAGLPQGRVLDKVDPKIGLPKTTKTKFEELATPKQKKELSRIRKQMDDNVKQQAAAIKDKDFTLVVALKEVYDSLILKMKDLVNEVVESVKNPTIGLSIRATVTPEKVAKAMDFEDFEDVARFLEDPQAALLNDKLMRMVDEMEIGKADLDVQVSFLKEVTDEAERLGLLQSNNLGKRNKQYQTTNNATKTDIDSSVPKNTKSATTETNLLEEAKKYENATDFINAQKENFAFHGTPFAEDIVKTEIKPSKSGNLGEGLYLSRDKNTAREFTKLQGGGKGSNFEDSGGGLYTEVSTGEQVQTTPGIFPYYIGDLNLKKLPDRVEQSPNFAKQAMKEGYDGVDASNSVQEPQVVVFPNAIKKMRGVQDMKKIWEQSQ